MKMLCAFAACLSAAGAVPVAAATYTFTFSATGQAGSGTVTTDDVTFASRGYTAQTIIGIAGTYNGSMITGLGAAIFGPDNLYYVSGPSFVDGSGFGFTTAAGNQVNLFYQDSAPSYRINTLNPFGSVFVTASSSASAVPEPVGWALMIAGFGAVGFGLRRHRGDGRSVRFA